MMGKKIIVAGVGVGVALAMFGAVALAISPPATFTATVRSNSCIVDLNWTGGGPQYRVQATTSLSFFGAQENENNLITGTTNTTFEHKKLPLDTTYRYRIYSQDGSNPESTSIISNPQSVQIVSNTLMFPPAPPAPVVPLGVGAVGVNDNLFPANDGKLFDIFWTQTTDLSENGGISIERASSANNSDWSAWSIVSNVPVDWVPPYRDGIAETLDNKIIYRYRIRFFDTLQGCIDPNRKYSSYVTSTVPVRPTELESAYIYNPDTNPVTSKINLDWIAGNGQTIYEIQRKTGSGTFSPLGSTVSNFFSDSSVVANEIYTYRVRGCKTEYGITGCSAFSNTIEQTTESAPQGLSAVPVSIGGTGALVRLTWKNTFAVNVRSKYVIERAPVNSASRVFIEVGQITIPTGSAMDIVSFNNQNVPLGSYYQYRVRADFSGSYSDYSVPADINLNVQAVKGWAWGGNGLGWVRLSNDSQSSSWGPTIQVPDSQPYTVYMEKDAPNFLGGFAWSPNGGWLSFNETSGCPLAECRARVDPVTSVIFGWAKFVGSVAGDGTKLGLDRWVSLSRKSGEKEYGLYYATTTDGGMEVGQLRGFIWGGDNVTGWLSFGGPVLTNVTRSEDGASANVEWQNPMKYGRVEIYRSYPETDPTNCKDPSKLTSATQCKYSKAKPQVDSSKYKQGLWSETVTGLAPEEKYGFFMRGYPE